MSSRNHARKGRPLGRAARFLSRATGMSHENALVVLIGHFKACGNMRKLNGSLAARRSK